MNARTIFIVAVLGVSVSIGLATSCNIGDLVQAKTPMGIQQDLGLPKSMSLNDSKDSYDAWIDDVRRDSQQWRENLEYSEQWVQLINGITMQALDQVGPLIAGVPILAPLAPLLLGGIGLMIKRRGDVTPQQLQAEKEGSYAKGRADAMATGP